MNVLDMLKYGDRTFKGAYERIPEENWEIGNVTGSWSVKNIVAHLTSFELVLADVITSLTDGGPTPHLDELRRIGRAFNDSEVAKREPMTPAETVAEYEAAHTQVLNLIPKIGAETFRKNGTLPWYGVDYCLDDFIVYINYAHKREHAAEINVFRDRIN